MSCSYHYQDTSRNIPGGLPATGATNTTVGVTARFLLDNQEDETLLHEMGVKTRAELLSEEDASGDLFNALALKTGYPPQFIREIDGDEHLIVFPNGASARVLYSPQPEPGMIDNNPDSFQCPHRYMVYDQDGRLVATGQSDDYHVVLDEGAAIALLADLPLPIAPGLEKSNEVVQAATELRAYADAMQLEGFIYNFTNEMGEDWEPDSGDPAVISMPTSIDGRNGAVLLYAPTKKNPRWNVVVEKEIATTYNSPPDWMEQQVGSYDDRASAVQSVLQTRLRAEMIDYRFYNGRIRGIEEQEVIARKYNIPANEVKVAKIRRRDMHYIPRIPVPQSRVAKGVAALTATNPFRQWGYETGEEARNGIGDVPVISRGLERLWGRGPAIVRNDSNRGRYDFVFSGGASAAVVREPKLDLQSSIESGSSRDTWVYNASVWDRERRAVVNNTFDNRREALAYAVTYTLLTEIGLPPSSQSDTLEHVKSDFDHYVRGLQRGGRGSLIPPPSVTISDPPDSAVVFDGGLMLSRSVTNGWVLEGASFIPATAALPDSVSISEIARFTDRRHAVRETVAFWMRKQLEAYFEQEEAHGVPGANR